MKRCVPGYVFCCCVVHTQKKYLYILQQKKAPDCTIHFKPGILFDIMFTGYFGFHVQVWETGHLFVNDGTRDNLAVAIKHTGMQYR